MIRNDVEDLLLERSERFWAMIARAGRGKPIAIETLRKQVAGRRPSAARTAASRPRGRLALRVDGLNLDS